MKSIRDLVQPHLRDLQAYTPGLQPAGTGWIKLNTNELPYPPPAEVGQAIAAEAGRLARYPDPRSTALRGALAELHGLAPEQLVIGNGSDDLLNLLARAFGGSGHRTVDTFPSYSLYPVVTAIAGALIQSVEFGPDFTLPVEQLVGAGADLVFLTCPNAPTGVRFPLADLRRLASGLAGRTLLVIDEAYAEFAGESSLPLLREFEHVVLTRTFSKAWGLAGLRVGYAMAAPAVIEVLDKIRDSYNVNRLSQAGALAALGRRDLYAGYVREIRQTRERVRGALAALGWQVFPSEANFLFGAPVDGSGRSGPDTAAALYRRLEERRILVRHFPKHPLTAPYLRISIGTPSEMQRFIEEVTTWQKGA